MLEYNFYIDDSGTRRPDRKPTAHPIGDWFALGGVLVAQGAEAEARELHAAFCAAWGISYPLHSIAIRHRSDNFAWIGQLDKGDQSRFYLDLEELISRIPVHVLACVVDRPGYNARYAPLYGTERWSICKTAFPIIAERAVKFAAEREARVRLYVEQSDKTSEGLLRGYYNKLRAEGMPFRNGGNDKYQPLAADEFRARLYDLKFKSKSSPMVQLADLVLYPLCREAYRPNYRPFQVLKDSGKLIEAALPPEQHATVGTKLSCFDLKDPSLTD